MIKVKKEQSESTKDLRKRRADLGMIRVEVWVGKEERTYILEYAKELREFRGLP